MKTERLFWNFRTPERRMKQGATKLGISFEEYRGHVDSGEKWCTACKAWHPRSDFKRDRTRTDGLQTRCLASFRGKGRSPRDPQKERARHAINGDVFHGRRPRASALPCTDCGHLGDDRRHEYDHHLGYDEAHIREVEPVCTVCHADREVLRGVVE